MARISRKIRNQREVSPKIYRVGLYLRLSVKEREESLAHQEMILRDFVKGKEEFQIHGVYWDYGKTGRHFQRNGIKNMVEDVKNQKIDCIMVKDFSRLGRNHLEMGAFLEQVIEKFKLRFIAVNHGYDSLFSTVSMEQSMHLINLANELYGDDLSNKIRSVKKIKQKEGVFMGSMAPYGYRKDEKHPGKLLVDQESAAVVQDIFLMRLQGMGYKEIARILEFSKVASPGRFAYERGLTRAKRCENARWSDVSVKNILENPVVVGDMVQGRYKKVRQGRKQILQTKEKWVVVSDTHEGIISREIFAQVKNKG